MFNLAQPRPRIPHQPRKEGVGGLRAPLPPQLLLSIVVGWPAGGAHRPGLTSGGSAGQLEPAPPAFPFPLLGRVPVKLWSITHSLSQLLPIFVLSVPPPLALWKFVFASLASQISLWILAHTHPLAPSLGVTGVSMEGSCGHQRLEQDLTHQG